MRIGIEDPQEAKPRRLMRGIVAAAVALVATSCLPAPVGDPEKSEVDERLNGVWYDAKEEQFWVFRAWDKRTWLVHWADMEVPPADAPADAAASPSEEAAPPTEEPAPPASEGGTGNAASWSAMKAVKLSAWKVWKTHLGGVRFLTLESVQELDSDSGLASPAWGVMRAEIEGDELILTDLDYDFEELDVENTADAIKAGTMTRREASRKFESVIARNARNPDLYTDQPRRLTRIAEDQYDDVADAIGLQSNFK